MTTSSAAYKAGDLSKLLNPTAPAPPVVNGSFDPTFFGYLKPKHVQKSTRKAPKGGGKFSKANLQEKVKEKKQVEKKVQERHEAQVVKDKERKDKEKEERLERKNKKKSAAQEEKKDEESDADEEEKKEDDADDDEEEDDGVDTDNSEIGDEYDEDAIENFMRDIEAEDTKGGRADGGEASDDDEDATMEDPASIAASAKRDRLAKKEKRLAEDAAMDAPAPRQKDIEKQRRENQVNDPRLSRTIFIGNVPTHYKTSRLAKWIETHLGIDSSTQQSIVESIRYRSVAVSDPKLPKKVAIQKGMLHDARDSLNAYCVFTEEKYVEEALEKCQGKEIEMEEKKWKVRIDRVTASASSKDKAKHDNTHTLFIGNLPFTVNENDLYSHFDNCGTISSVRIIRDRQTQLGKGIAYIQFADEQSMKNALASNGVKFKGERELRIMKAVENKKLHQTIPNSASSSGKGGAASQKKGGSNDKNGNARKEGYGGVHKIKEVNNAGVLKKPRHVPRTGESTAASSSSSSSNKKVAGKKRAFEGEHANPQEQIKKQKMEEIKHQEKKEKRKDAKKIGGASSSSTKKD